MKNVFFFPGQGAQTKGMIQDICDSYPEAMKVVKDVESITGESVSKYLWETEDAELARSDRSQLAITTASLAIVEALKTKGIQADICAGFSLGEFSALCIAGVMSFEDTIKVVQQRGKIMQETCEELSKQNGSEGDTKPGMAAVIGLTPEQVASVIEPLRIAGIAFPANMNSPKQTVISGTAEGLQKAEELCKSAGARRFIRLKVAGPFHSPLMKKAADEFSKVLDNVVFMDPKKILLSNVTGKQITIGEEAKQLAVKHFTHSVLWTSEEAEIAKLIDSSNPDCAKSFSIYEVGPGNVLSGLWRDSTFAEFISSTPVNKLENLTSL